MEIVKLKLEGTYEIKPKIFEDSRGFFAETYLATLFEENGLSTHWTQENHSHSLKRGTIRGLHFQSPPFAQAKLITVISGRILDVFLDVRKASTTFGQWDSVEISAESGNSVYVAAGFAHGFCTLEDETSVQYKVDNYYSMEHEGGIRWDDPELDINWRVNDPILSEKDRLLPQLSTFKTPF